VQIVDLSQTVFSGSPVYRGHQPTVIHPLKSVEELPDGRWTFAINGVFMSDHCGTHTDSFRHMDGSPSAEGIHELPVEMFQGLGVCLDLSTTDPTSFITREAVVEAATMADVDFANHPPKVVLIYTGHYGRTFPKPLYGSQHPGLDRAAMTWLADKGVINVGIDCPSIDIEPHSGNEWKPAHSVCRERRILNTENPCTLSEWVSRSFYYMGLPIKIVNGTAGRIRAVAILLDEEDVETCKYLVSLK